MIFEEALRLVGQSWSDIKMRTHTRRSFLNFINRSAPAVETYWLHVNRTAMACRFEITLPTEEREGVAAAVEALNEVDRIEAQLTVFRDTSLVSYINRRAAQEPVEVDRAVFELLSRCKEIHSQTSGAFDITSGPLTRCWGFFKRQGRFPDATEIQTAMDMVGSDKLILDKRFSQRELCHRGHGDQSRQYRKRLCAGLRSDVTARHTRQRVGQCCLE